MNSQSESREQLQWDDVEVGDRLEGFAMTLGWTAVAAQLSGSQDWNLVHHDPDFARESGHSAIFFNTGWTSGLLSRVITDWMGPRGQLLALEFEMRKMNVFGDTVQARGAVTGKSVGSDGRSVVALDVWLENDRLGITTPAKAQVSLPAAGDTQGSGD